jgi:hypothetical protein
MDAPIVGQVSVALAEGKGKGANEKRSGRLWLTVADETPTKPWRRLSPPGRPLGMPPRLSVARLKHHQRRSRAVQQAMQSPKELQFDR